MVWDAASDLALLLAQPIAHRGLHGCGRDGPIENSLGAAKAAVAKGYAIECDVQLSRDGEAMVFHDFALDRLTGAQGPLRDRDAAALKRIALRGGGPDRVPTLADLLTTIGGQVPLVIEIKTGSDGDQPLTDRTLTLLEDYAGPVAIESFDPQVVLRCRQRGTNRPVGLVGPPESDDEGHQDALDTCDFLSWSIDHIAEAATRHCALPRTTWTVRTPEQAAHAAFHQAQIVFEGLAPLP